MKPKKPNFLSIKFQEKQKRLPQFLTEALWGVELAGVEPASKLVTKNLFIYMLRLFFRSTNVAYS